MEWLTRKTRYSPAYGVPTDANLAAFVARYEASTRPGGCNVHLGPDVVLSAYITDGISKLATYTRSTT